MKITENNSARLVLDDRPWLLGAVLVLAIVTCLGFATGLLVSGRTGGFVLLLVAAGFGLAGAVFVRRTQAVFDRASDAATVTQRSLFGQTAEQMPLASLRAASVESRTSRGGKGQRDVSVHRVVLYLNGHDVARPLMQVYVTGEAPAQAAAAINAWLLAA